MAKTYLTNKDLTKYLSEITKSRVICKCGHSVLIPTNDNKAVCHWCGNFVFRNKEAEFKHRMKENLIKERRNLK